MFGESRTLAIKQFLSLECALQSKGEFEDFAHAVKEYFTMGHGEPVVKEDLNKPLHNMHYLLMQVVKSETRSTSKICIVFNASTKTTSGA